MVNDYFVCLQKNGLDNEEYYFNNVNKKGWSEKQPFFRSYSYASHKRKTLNNLDILDKVNESAKKSQGYLLEQNDNLNTMNLNLSSRDNAQNSSNKMIETTGDNKIITSERQNFTDNGLRNIKDENIEIAEE